MPASWVGMSALGHSTMLNCSRTLVVMVLMGVIPLEFVVKFDNVGISSIPTKLIAGPVEAEDKFPTNRLTFLTGHVGADVGHG